MRLRSLWLLLPVITACVTPSVASRPARDIDAPLPGEEPAAMVIVDRGERPPPPPPSQDVQREYVYFGGHPIPDEYGGGWCIEEGAHSHPYLPAAQEQYVYQQGGFAFRDDVDWWDYEYGHPIPVEYGGGWCGLVEVHHHHYRPWVSYWWNPERRAYVYVDDARPVSGQRIVRGTPRRDRRPPKVITVPSTPVPPSGTVARPVPVQPSNGGNVARPVSVEPHGGGTVARPVPVQPTPPIAKPAPRERLSRPIEIHEPERPPFVTPVPVRPEVRTDPVRSQPIEMPTRPPVIAPTRPSSASSPPMIPVNPNRPPMVEPARPRLDTGPRVEPPRFQQSPPPINPHYPTATTRSAPAAVHSTPVAPTTTRSVIPAPAPVATPSKKAPAAAVKSQRR